MNFLYGDNRNKGKYKELNELQHNNYMEYLEGRKILKTIDKIYKIIEWRQYQETSKPALILDCPP